MLQATIKGTGLPGAPAMVLMHFLGGSTREWDEVVALLGAGFRTVALDLPGFGTNADVPGYSVEHMADSVEDLIGRLQLGRYVLVGHSMSGKVAAVLARRFADRALSGASDGHGRGSIHAERLNGLAGLVLIAPSPPSPEPMAGDKRSSMLDNLGESHHDDRRRARSYITKNEERDLSPAVLERAVTEVLKMNRAAWVAWLEHGSKEDWSERVGVLELPTIIVAGEKDRSLGPDQQQEFTLPHFAHAKLHIVAGSSHLVPMEKPHELAAILCEFITELSRSGPAIPAPYQALIDSDRVSPATRAVLQERFAGPQRTEVLTAAQMDMLGLLCARVVPQQAGHEIDLAGTIAARLATGKGDGWRYSALPEDLEAYKQGLDDLAARGFAHMDDDAKDALLHRFAAAKGSPEAHWFEEVRGDATTAYISHPATYARIGYSGIGVGGANTPHHGFVAISVGEVEPWEPVSLAETSEGRAS
jgi:pimeloyl-ACP methyl ester carboxylesterase